MKNKIFFTVVSIALFLFMAQPCWAITINRVSGDIYAEVGTTYLSGGVWSKSGWDASGGVLTPLSDFDNSTGVGAYGYASGQKINGDTGSNHARFILSSTAQSKYGSIGASFDTYSLVSSGPNPDDMIKFILTPGAGEVEGQDVQLTAQAMLAGTLNSSGLTFLNPAWESGTATVEFIFQIYKDPNEAAIMSFSYSDLVKNVSTTDMEKSTILPGILANMTDIDTFKVGDDLYVYFEQITHATVAASPQSSAKAFAVQSTNDVITIAIEANVKPVPEPSTLMLLGSGLIGAGFYRWRRMRK